MSNIRHVAAGPRPDIVRIRDAFELLDRLGRNLAGRRPADARATRVGHQIHPEGCKACRLIKKQRSISERWLVLRVAQFVAHPNVQQLLGTIWYQGLPGFRRRSMLGQLVQTLKIAIQFPLHSMFYMLAPTSVRGAFIKLPFVKFICHTASYLFFLCTFLFRIS